MTEQRVSVGLVGVANHGATILQAILASGNLELVTCFDKDLDASKNVSQKTGCKVADSYESLVADRQIQAVALVTPNHLHAEQLRKAVAAGKHIFVEKPISNTIPEAREMIALAKKGNRVMLVGHNTRRRRVFRRTKELLQQNAIGKIVAVEGNLSRPAGLEPGLPPWKADPKKCPLLPMTQLGIHLVDTTTYLLGSVRSVSCVATNIAMMGNVYDSTAAVLQLESGIPFTLSSYYVSPDAYFLRIYGTGGLIVCHPTHLRVELINPVKAFDEDFKQEGMESYVLQMQEFGDCVLHNKQPETGGEEGLHALAVIEAMSQSVATGRIITIQEVLQE